jgi:hypothetical protein
VTTSQADEAASVNVFRKRDEETTYEKMKETLKQVLSRDDENACSTLPR